MSKKKMTVLVEHEYMIIKAATVGFFYNYGKRQNVCQHRTCGWKRPDSRACYYMKLLTPDGDPHGNKVYYTKLIREHKKKACKPDWCIEDNGPRPEGWPEPKPNLCKKTYFRAYTEQQLANPNTKVELVALSVSVAEQDRMPRNNLICVYDLMNDRWYTDKWWKLTPKGDLSPYTDWGLVFAPSVIQGIDEVIAKAKAGI